MPRKQSQNHAHRRISRITLFGALTVGITGLIAVAGIVWVLLGGTGQLAATDPDASGRLIAQATTVDLGRVPFDQLTEARFDLVNTGGSTVRLIGAPRVRMLEGC